MSTEERTDFIRNRIRDDLAAGKNDGRVHTRFPPEPNGYLHIGHAKAICLNFGVAQEFQGAKCNLRFDDTNPAKEDTEYVEAIERDIRWLGFEWEGEALYASDYFERLYQFAMELVDQGLAYVDQLTPEQIREYRGDLHNPGKNSPFRDRPVAENKELLEKMRAGGFEDGAVVLRAKIDMAHPNMNMRDPIIYRVRRVTHHRTGDDWCIYPMYDFAHGLSDAIEGITHSLCSLEFEHHRPLYDWFIENLPSCPAHPQQIEFARLNLTYTLMSKRKLLQLVEKGIVSGWDDPRMPTLSGMRRRGYTAAGIRMLCEKVGVAKFNSTIDLALLEHCLREDLNKKALRVMAVKDPIKLIVTNYPEGQTEEMDAVNNPENEADGKRKVPFSRELWIERDDYREEAPNKYRRLVPGREVRLRWAYIVKCTGFERDEDGNIIAVLCEYDPETRGGDTPDGRKIKGTIHWVSAEHAVDVEVREYGLLFNAENPAAAENYEDVLNPDSLVVKRAYGEPSLRDATPETPYQFERIGYYTPDRDHTAEKPVFNSTVGLRDTWAKIEKKGGK